jgi:hypothetical protein
MPPSTATSVTNQSLSELKLHKIRSVGERVNSRRVKFMVKDARHGDLELLAVLEIGIQREHQTACKHAAKLRRSRRYEAMRRNNYPHTEMIIAKDRKRAMTVFWVLEFWN